MKSCYISAIWCSLNWYFKEDKRKNILQGATRIFWFAFAFAHQSSSDQSIPQNPAKMPTRYWRLNFLCGLVGIVSRSSHQSVFSLKSFVTNIFVRALFSAWSVGFHLGIDHIQRHNYRADALKSQGCLNQADYVDSRAKPLAEGRRNQSMQASCCISHVRDTHVSGKGGPGGVCFEDSSKAFWKTWSCSFLGFGPFTSVRNYRKFK